MFKQISKREAQVKGLCENCKTTRCEEFCLLIEEVREEKRCPHCKRILNEDSSCDIQLQQATIPKRSCQNAKS
jgi:hypothetical protein